MAKIEKHAEFMDKLHGMITKEATAGTASGKPGADTHYTSVSKETEHVDKNKEGHPEKNPQEVKQEKAHDSSDPTKTHKSAEEIEAEKTAELEKEATKVAPQVTSTAVAKPGETAKNEVKQTVKTSEETPSNEKLAQLGQQLLDTINEMNKQATAGTASGKPGADTHYASVGSEHDKVDKNKQGKPENNPQEFKQEKGKAAPITNSAKHAEEAELELDKEASFQLGRNFARAFLASKTAESNIYKEAGRRDFEALIAQASSELETESKTKVAAPVAVAAPVQKQAEAQTEDLQVKQAEEAGAQAFYALLKQAQDEEKANQTKLAFDNQINALLAEKQAAESKAAELAAKLAAQEANIQKQAEESKLDAKFAQWGGRVVEEVISRLKSEPLK